MAYPQHLAPASAGRPAANDLLTCHFSSVTAAMATANPGRAWGQAS